MPFFDTQNFGTVDYKTDSVVEFPSGLPGFEECRLFVALTFPDTHPLVFLQSLEDGGLCFITLPVLSIDQQYRLETCEDELKKLGLPAERQPRIGEDVACLAVLTLQESGPTANLLAPIVINVRNLQAVQVIVAEAGYSHQHALSPRGAVQC